MTSSGKVRIYELSRDLGLDNKDVLDAAEKLSIAARSHSSSISDDEASRIRDVLVRSSGGGAASTAPPAAKAILSVKKASADPSTQPQAQASPAAAKPAPAPARPSAPAAKPSVQPARASAPPTVVSQPPGRPTAPPARPAAPARPQAGAVTPVRPVA